MKQSFVRSVSGRNFHIHQMYVERNRGPYGSLSQATPSLRRNLLDSFAFVLPKGSEKVRLNVFSMYSEILVT